MGPYSIVDRYICSRSDCGLLKGLVTVLTRFVPVIQAIQRDSSRARGSSRLICPPDTKHEKRQDTCYEFTRSHTPAKTCHLVDAEPQEFANTVIKHVGHHTSEVPAHKTCEIEHRNDFLELAGSPASTRTHNTKKHVPLELADTTINHCDQKDITLGSCRVPKELVGQRSVFGLAELPADSAYQTYIGLSPRELLLAQTPPPPVNYSNKPSVTGRAW